jgi:FkbM family methyltransferase
MLRLLLSSRYSSRNGWTISCVDSRIVIENLIDFLTIYDFHVDRHYASLEQFRIPNSVLWDIGANVGAVSLRFARLPWIAHVFAYEPVPETAAFAQRSVALNPNVSGKITIKVAGVEAGDGFQTVRYSRKVKNATGSAGVPPHLMRLGRATARDFKDISIRLIDAAAEFRSIRCAYPNSHILMKLDAEGSEYGILWRLEEEGLLGEISAAVVEWHQYPGETYVCEKLKGSGFLVTAKNLQPDGSIGLAIAHR